MALTWRQRRIIWLHSARAPVLAALFLALILGLILLSDYYKNYQNSPVVDQRPLSGTVVRVFFAESNTGVYIDFISVRLSDGTEVRAKTIFQHPPAIGAVVPVVEERHANGQVRYVIE